MVKYIKGQKSKKFKEKEGKKESCICMVITAEKVFHMALALINHNSIMISFIKWGLNTIRCASLL